MLRNRSRGYELALLHHLSPTFCTVNEYQIFSMILDDVGVSNDSFSASCIDNLLQSGPIPKIPPKITGACCPPLS